MTSFSQQVASGNDNAYLTHYYNTLTINPASFLGIGSAGGFGYESAARVQVNVPQGATINSAYITVVPYQTRAGGTIVIDAEASNDASAFSDATDFLARSRTTASVSWAAGTFTKDAPMNTADISAVIQEVVNRVGWVANNYMVLFLPTNFSAAPTNYVYSYTGSSAKAVGITIDYTEGGGISIPVVMHHLRQQGIA